MAGKSASGLARIPRLFVAVVTRFVYLLVSLLFSQDLHPMATISATFGTSLKLPFKNNAITGSTSSLKMVTFGLTKNRFPSIKTHRFSVSCAARPETVQKVCEVVRKQLALSPESVLTPETKFSALGADSLDTVEIVMGLEEEFGITVEEESSENITTVQEAADLIEKLVQKKPKA